MGISFATINPAVARATFYPLLDNTYDLGTATKAFKDAYLDGNLKTANNTWIQQRNQANAAWLNVLKVDTSNNTIINAVSGQNLNLRINENTCWSIGSGGWLMQDGTYGNDIAFAKSAGTAVIRQSTVDGADNSNVIVAGGGATGITRGAFIQLEGNESSGNNGHAVMRSGSASNALAIIDASSAASPQILLQTTSLNRWVVDGSGNLTQDATNGGSLIISKASTGVVSGATSVNADVSAVASPQLYAFGTLGMATLRGTADTTGSMIALMKSRSTDGSANTIVVSGDEIGKINFYGSNGTTFDLAAQIIVKSDGTPGASADMPSRIEFYTCNDASATPVRRWYVASSGDLTQDSSQGGNIVFTKNGSANVYSTGASAMGIGTNANQALNLRANSSDRWVVSTNGNFTQDATNGGCLVFGKALTGVADIVGTKAALGTTQTDAAAITTTVTQVTAADGAKGVKLPGLSTITTGQTLVIVNSSTTGILKYYTNAVGELIFGQAGTTAVSLPAKATALCRKYDATNWYCTHEAAPF